MILLIPIAFCRGLSIGIEICMYQGMDTQRCWRHAAWLVVHLLDKHKLPIDRVVPHQKWSGKHCPSQLLPYWDKFICMVRKEMRKTVNITGYGKDVCEGVFTNGCIMTPVRPVGEALGVKVGWNGKCPTVNGVKVAGSKVIGSASYALIRTILNACTPRIAIGDKMRELNILK